MFVSSQYILQELTVSIISLSEMPILWELIGDNVTLCVMLFDQATNQVIG